jgi:sulfoxide reductase heme-binding subunit YedZ
VGEARSAACEPALELGGAKVSLSYAAVGWNRQKRIYDAVLACGSLAYLAVFTGLGAVLYPQSTAETLLIRGLGTLALLLLHVILCIGPLCRLDARFLPLLYNRRHLGVTMFTVALAHGAFSLVQFHGFGNVGAIRRLFESNTQYGSLAGFPFETLGAAALLILFLMAATSHDFWLRNLSPAVWKSLHLMVYAAYALLAGHVAFGALQSETSPVLVGLLVAGAMTVSALHVLAARRESRIDRFQAVCELESIPENRARIVVVDGERVAVFRQGGTVSALSNVCAHQNGPLGEGRIIDGCVTCPWHGYQYLPATGRAPEPYTEKVAVYRTRIADGKVWVESGGAE